MLSCIDDFMLAAAFLRGSDAFDLLADSFNPQSRILDGWGSLFVGFECEGSAVVGPRRSLILSWFYGLSGGRLPERGWYGLRVSGRRIMMDNTNLLVPLLCYANGAGGI